jgi:DNA-binding response OmpR family regulator
MKLGREIIRLDSIEYGVLTFLAAHPYRAYSRRQIARVVSTERNPVTEESLDRHVASLRGKLGFFRDYIQTVPHLGYRFKA